MKRWAIFNCPKAKGIGNFVSCNDFKNCKEMCYWCVWNFIILIFENQRERLKTWSSWKTLMTLNTSIIRQTLRNVKFGIRKKYIATLLSLSLQSLFTTWDTCHFYPRKLLKGLQLFKHHYCSFGNVNCWWSILCQASENKLL